jgi:hypothetical protein
MEIIYKSLKILTQDEKGAHKMGVIKKETVRG